MTSGELPIAVAGLCGLVLGSYAVTAGLRAARGEGATLGRSRCDACQVTLSFLRTVPVLSYVGQRGACAACGARIDALHLVGEIAGAAVLIGALVVDDPLRSGLVALCGLTLIGSAAVDWKIQRLPDPATALVGLACLTLAATRSAWDLGVGLLSAGGVGLVLLGLRRWSSRGGRPPGLGLGDVKLAAVLAVWIGLHSAWMLAVASALGLLAIALRRPVDGRLAFGPMIAITGWSIGMISEVGLWPTTM